MFKTQIGFNRVRISQLVAINSHCFCKANDAKSVLELLELLEYRLQALKPRNIGLFLGWVHAAYIEDIVFPNKTIQV